MRKISITYFILTFIVSFCVLFAFNTKVSARAPDNLHNFANDNGDGFLKDPPKKFEKGFWLKLNDEQKEELRAAIKELKSKGATREEIKTEIAKYLEKWGIEIKKKFEKGFWLKLNDEQKEELRAAIKKLKSEGATREEIKAEIDKYLKKWGIEIKKKFERGFWLKLNDEQKEELRAAIKKLKSEGATPKEIKAKINEYLEKWGIKRKKP